MSYSFVILGREAANESPPIVSGRLPCPYSADRIPLTVPGHECPGYVTRCLPATVGQPLSFLVQQGWVENPTYDYSIQPRSPCARFVGAGLRPAPTANRRATTPLVSSRATWPQRQAVHSQAQVETCAWGASPPGDKSPGCIIRCPVHPRIRRAMLLQAVERLF